MIDLEDIAYALRRLGFVEVDIAKVQAWIAEHPEVDGTIAYRVSRAVMSGTCMAPL